MKRKLNYLLSICKPTALSYHFISITVTCFATRGLEGCSYRFVWPSHNPLCTPACRPPWGKTRPRWPVVGCTWCRRNSAGGTQSPAPCVPPAWVGSPVGTLHILSRNACREKKGSDEKDGRRNKIYQRQNFAWPRMPRFKMFSHSSHEWWHRVCINRAPSCCREKNQHWNAFVLTIELSAWLMTGINALCCVCTPASACVFACLCVCRWSTKSWGGQRGGGAPIVNTPRGEPINHWLRRGSKSDSRRVEIKKKEGGK